ncbi:carbon storage regulator [Legionella anisa]|uniref:Carbon storage regulator n=1 Tax=Legionella anisa TaxID=28082 RepID=A0AAX0WPX9_9GAMM|nr:carbon storage regulator [Legionella anisa]AWN73046.1 carbon storage regulator [Legionella anisa]KTC75637.1 global regulator [Legionella anisa]MBN5936257.1 carbon storage regulator [Legionella anisa]MCW8423868.1 carbon storage regulator [Legionella anisa]MCW8447390.1 carbon storage regulator [Legionella anisa]
MLFLTRKVGESVIIGEEIYCTVLGYQHGEICLAFDAPQSLPIHREEIQRRINRDRQKDQWYREPVPNQESVVDRLINKFKHEMSPA